MKIAIYTPYLDSLGGGERYMMSIASCLSDAHSVSIFSDDLTIINRLTSRFGIDLSRVSIVPNIFIQRSLWKKLIVTSKYDCIFFLTDGSIPISAAKKNILHVQAPLTSSRFPIWKRWFYKGIIFNSHFTKSHVHPTFNAVRSWIVYPPVSPIPVSKKQNVSKTILTVGRFRGYRDEKKHEILIEAFKRLTRDSSFQTYKLMIVGSLSQNARGYFEALKKQIGNLNITLHPNCSYEELKSVYAQARIYWHGAGYGETDPANMEHFGIAPVEAMSAGVVPIVHNSGGLIESIEHGKNGYVWNSIDELVSQTKMILHDPKTYAKLSASAISQASRFSHGMFCYHIQQILSVI